MTTNNGQADWPVIYTIDALNKKYHDLFYSILKAVTRNDSKEQFEPVFPPRNEDGKVLADYRNEKDQYDRDYFYDFVGNIPNSLKSEFKKQLETKAFIPQSTWTKMRENGLPDIKRAELAFCLSAFLNKQDITSRLVSFLRFCPTKANLYGTRKFGDIVQELIGGKSAQNDSVDFGRGIEAVFGEAQWLNPLNQETISFVGRERELTRLDSFVSYEGGDFKIWGLVAPSGAGKTRLVVHWCQTSKALAEWHIQFFHKNDIRNVDSWLNWQPTRPTLFVIDYMFGFEEILSNLITTCQKHLEHPVRLLVLDHALTVPLYLDIHWCWAERGMRLDILKNCFYDSNPLTFSDEVDCNLIITKIISQRTGLNEDDPKIDEAKDYLKNTSGAWQPLFAALIAESIRLGKAYRSWSRYDIIKYYLDGERLPWRHQTDDGYWASCFIAVATARRGMTYKQFIEYDYKNDDSPDDFESIITVCQKIISSTSKTILRPYEPDLIGETFFLLFLDKLNTLKPKWSNHFYSMFLVGDQKEQARDANAFIGFIIRLASNLLKEEYSPSELKKVWANLTSFLNPELFPEKSPIRQAVLRSLLRIGDLVKDNWRIDRLKSIGLVLKPALMCELNSFSFGHAEAYESLQHFELMVKQNPPLSRQELDEQLTEFERACVTASPLLIASSIGATSAIESLIDRGYDVNYLDEESDQTALITASIYDQPEVVQVLLDYGATPNLKNQNRRTALHAACEYGLLNIITILHDNGANLFELDIDDSSAMHIACMFGDLAVVKYLFEKNLDINAEDCDGYTPLMCACSEGNLAIIEILLQWGASTDKFAKNGFNAFLLACRNGHLSTLKFLLKNNNLIDINVSLPNKTNGLMLACSRGFSDVAKFLIEREINIEAETDEGLTAWAACCQSGLVDIVELLLERKAVILHIKNKYGATALFDACIEGQLKVVKTLVKFGADINAKTFDQSTPLMEASHSKAKDIVEFLLKQDCIKIDEQNDKGVTALMLASSVGCEEIVDLLLANQANVNKKRKDGATALMAAVQFGFLAIVKKLLNAGADINYKLYLGNVPTTALTIAYSTLQLPMIEYLISQGGKEFVE